MASRYAPVHGHLGYPHPGSDLGGTEASLDKGHEPIIAGPAPRIWTWPAGFDTGTPRRRFRRHRTTHSVRPRRAAIYRGHRPSRDRASTSSSRTEETARGVGAVLRPSLWRLFQTLPWANPTLEAICEAVRPFRTTVQRVSAATLGPRSCQPVATR